MDPDEHSTIRRRRRPVEVMENAEPFVVVLQGASIGRLYKLGEGGHVIGRSLDADIQLDEDSVSRRHARIERTGELEFVITDLGSTNGTAVNGQRVDSHELEDGDVIELGKGAVLKFSLQSELEGKLSERLYEAATRDALTGLFNRLPFEQQLAKDFAHATRHRAPLSVLVFDLDFFKRVNDTHGHPAGDAVLRQIGELVAASIRAEDVACRLGGEEFAIAMRDTGWDGAQRLAERLRLAVERHEFEAGETKIPITISVGTATFETGRHDGVAALIDEADQALYRAKRSGRNRVVAGLRPAGDPPVPTPRPADLRKTKH